MCRESGQRKCGKIVYTIHDGRQESLVREEDFGGLQSLYTYLYNTVHEEIFCKRDYFQFHIQEASNFDELLNLSVHNHGYVHHKYHASSHSKKKKKKTCVQSTDTFTIIISPFEIEILGLLHFTKVILSGPLLLHIGSRMSNFANISHMAAVGKTTKKKKKKNVR